MSRYWSIDRDSRDHEQGTGVLESVDEFDNYPEALNAFKELDVPPGFHTLWLGRKTPREDGTVDTVTITCKSRA